MKNKKTKKGFGFGDVFLLLVLVGMILGVFFRFDGGESKIKNLSYTEFVTELNNGNVNTIIASPVKGEDNKGITQVEGELKDGYKYTVLVPTEDQYNTVVDKALEANIKINQVPLSTVNFLNIIISLLPFILIGFMLMSLMKANGGGMGTQQ